MLGGSSSAFQWRCLAATHRAAHLGARAVTTAGGCGRRPRDWRTQTAPRARGPCWRGLDVDRDHDLAPADGGGEGRERARRGPFTTWPAVVKREPWHGQSRLAPGALGSATVQPWCVQMRDTATTSVCEIRVTVSGVLSQEAHDGMPVRMRRLFRSLASSAPTAGTSRAIGRPRSVTKTSSPLLTTCKSAESEVFSSDIDARFMRPL